MVGLFLLYNLSSKIFIEKIISTEYCKEIGLNNYEKINNTLLLPKSIRVEISTIRNWYKNILNIIITKNNKKHRIPSELKNYYKSKIHVEYNNGKKCIFNSRVRVHGGAVDHIRSDLSSSLRVELFDGNIQNITKFTLFNTGTRLDDNEIFITALLNHLGYISPLTFNVDVKFPSNTFKKMTFQERLTEQLLKSNNKRSGPILAGNKNRYLDNKIRNTGLTRIMDFGGLENNNKYHKEIFLKALDKLNYGYLFIKNSFETGGIKGGGDPMLNLPLPKILFENDELGYEKMAVFEALMIALGGSPGLAMEDRRFYYDAINDRIEPIYYDGMVKILDNFQLEIKDKNYFISDFQKQGAKKARLLLLSLNEVSLFEYLQIVGMQITLKKLKNIINLSINNLIKIENATNTPIVSDTKDYFANNKYSSEYDFSLAFNGEKNIFLICDVFIKNCFKKKFNDNEFIQIITNQISNIEGEKYRYVRNNLYSYLKKIKPVKSGIKKMKQINLNQTAKLFFNDKTDINININNKTVQIKQIEESGRVLIKGGVVDGWRFQLSGFGMTEINYKTDNNNISGCITFIDTKIKDISLFAENSSCPDAVHFINTTGTINNVVINNSSSDAFDADFSDLKVDSIKINNAGEECIGVKQGNYHFNKSILIKCNDRAVSSGEHANTNLIDSEISFAKVGLAAKDSSTIIAEKVFLKKVELCILSFRQNINYSGSFIKTGSEDFFCDNNTYQIDKFSQWLNN